MKASFLSSSVPLTKTFKIENGELKKEGHPRVVEYDSYAEDWETIEDLFDLLTKHADKGHCFLKGVLNRELKNESRAGTTNPNEPTKLLVLDLDGVKDVESVDALLKLMGASDVDHIVQFSSSMGVVPDRGISAHVFMLVDKEHPPAVLKQWLRHLNLTIPALKQNLGLARTGNSLRWTLDITTCQNDKLIYIAPPVLGPGVVDELVGNRIKLVKRKRRAHTIPIPMPNAEANKQAEEKALNELRERDGLPKRKRAVYKTSGSVEYMGHPDQATVTGIKHERGFTYLNLNGGDSFAYYHPQNNPEFIYNFKSEPIFKTSELVPDYWAEVKKTVNERKVDANGTLYLAFRDFKTAAYWNGTWKPSEQKLEFAQAKSIEQLKHFLKQHGQPAGDFVPDWAVRFEPNSTSIVDVEGRFVNTFQPSSYMHLPPDPKTEVPPLIKRVVLHALGGDVESYEHFMNWLAVIFQFRCRTETAWVMHGVPGTGKGLMLNKVLRPLLKYAVSKRTRELDSQFNGYMEQCLLLWIDEAEIGLHPGHSLIESDLKNYIVEPIVSIRRMQMLSYEAPNYMNVILSSNKGEIITIDPKDRRFNVAPFQPLPLEITQEEVNAIEGQLDQFAQYLLAYNADRQKARTPLNNVAKQKLVHIGMKSIDVVCQAVIDGNLAFLLDQKPSGHLQHGNTSRDILAGSYIRLMDDIETGNKPALSREELQIILEYTVGGMPQTPYKFSSMIKHHGMLLEPVNVDGKTTRGIKINWKGAK